MPLSLKVKDVRLQTFTLPIPWRTLVGLVYAYPYWGQKTKIVMERQLSHLETVRILCSVTDRFHTALCKRKSAIPAELLTTRHPAPHGCFPIRFKKATRSLAPACGFFICNAHMLIRYAHAHIRIMHSRLYRFAHAYIQICTCIYTDLHGYIYGNAQVLIRFFDRLIQWFFARIAAWFTFFSKKDTVFIKNVI